MASHNNHLQSTIFVEGFGGNMAGYLRRYSNYLNEKREAYKLMGYDFCKVKRGLETFNLNSTKFIRFIF